MKNERSNSKKINLQSKIEQYIQRAEELKQHCLRKPQNDMPHLANATSFVSSETKYNRSDSDRENSSENMNDLVQKCSTTPQMKLGLEILLSAESYEKEKRWHSMSDLSSNGREVGYIIIDSKQGIILSLNA